MSRRTGAKDFVSAPARIDSRRDGCLSSSGWAADVFPADSQLRDGSREVRRDFGEVSPTELRDEFGDLAWVLGDCEWKDISEGLEVSLGRRRRRGVVSTSWDCDIDWCGWWSIPECDEANGFRTDSAEVLCFSGSRYSWSSCSVSLTVRDRAIQLREEKLGTSVYTVGSRELGRELISSRDSGVLRGEGRNISARCLNAGLSSSSSSVLSGSGREGREVSVGMRCRGRGVGPSLAVANEAPANDSSERWNESSSAAMKRAVDPRCKSIGTDTSDESIDSSSSPHGATLSSSRSGSTSGASCNPAAKDAEESGGMSMEVRLGVLPSLGRATLGVRESRGVLPRLCRDMDQLDDASYSVAGSFPFR